VALEELAAGLAGYRVPAGYAERVEGLQAEWEQEVLRVLSKRSGPPLSQAEVIAAVNEESGPRDVVVCAAGSLPGDLHKLWRTRDAKGYHMEYGYSCMGYEIAGGLGVKMAAPDREVYVMVGDGSYLMMAQELVTAVQEGIKLNVILLDNHGYSSINGLSHHCGVEGFATLYRHRQNGQLNGQPIPVDFAANAASLGVEAVRARTHAELREALRGCRAAAGTRVIVVETELTDRVGGYESWWDVPVAEVSVTASAQRAYAEYVEGRKQERPFLQPAEVEGVDAGVPAGAPKE
jgi:3D-(3,5/4)-trihydroxycyclohexane-1,2-dione acylhydrolase (decyclizing)